MIRKITESDIQWINENIKEDMWLIWISSEFSTFEYNSSIWNPWYVYIDDSGVTAWFIMGDTDSYRRYWEIVRLYIYDWFRWKWIWTKLVKKAEEYLRSIWMSSCELVTFKDNSKDFYIKNWYEVIADYEKKYHKNDPYKRRIIMAKVL